MAAKQKSHRNVKGWLINCPNYQMCPLCYGCRAYDPSFIKCEKCAENKKFNICNTKLHKEKLLSKMIIRERIEVKE